MSFTVSPLSIQTITFFISVLNHDPEQELAPKRCPDVDKSKAIATFFRIRHWISYRDATRLRILESVRILTGNTVCSYRLLAISYRLLIYALNRLAELGWWECSYFTGCLQQCPPCSYMLLAIFYRLQVIIHRIAKYYKKSVF